MKFFKYICHQKPERTFKINGRYMPVCARCTGFYIAAILFGTLSRFIAIDYNLPLLIVAAILLLPAAIDGTSQLWGLRESNNILRLFTGLLGGLGLAIIYLAFFKYFLPY